MEILSRADSKRLSKVRLVGNGENEIVDFLKAFEQADDMGLDLVLVSDEVTPPVVRIQDFKKIQYEKKKARAKTAKASELKEIQLKINISDHDLGTKVNAIEKFLSRGDKVKITIRLKGRERENPERARELLGKITEMVDCKVSMLGGPITSAILEPERTAVKK